MKRSEYNAKIKEIQAMWPEDKTRVRPVYLNEKLVKAEFQVAWDGWQTIGVQKSPFVGSTTYEWNEDLEMRLRGAFAGALIHS